MRFKLHAHVTVSCYIEVDAATEQEALTLAEENGNIVLKDEAGGDYESQWVIEEADGMPTEIRVMT